QPHGLQHVRILDLGWETEEVIACVGDDHNVGLQSFRFVGRKNAYSLHIPIRVPHRDSTPSTGFDDVLQQVIGSAEDEDTVCRYFAKLLTHKRGGAIHD